MKELLLFYRIKGWKNKLSCLRFMVYPLLGFALSPFKPLNITIDTLVVAGGSMSAYAINDYFDFKLKGEKNFSSRMTKKMGEKKTLILAFLPLLLLPLALFTTLPTFLSLLFLLFLTLSYSAPPFRLKERGWGFLIPPLCSPLLFLQAHLALAFPPSRRALLLLPLLFLFQLHLEILHLLDVGRVKSVRWLKISPFPHFLLSSLFSLGDPFFLIGVFSSCVRFLAVRRIKRGTNFLELRKRAWKPEIFAEELALYAIYGLAKGIK
ncbi:MAG: hypothetical protein QXF20_05015 [Candidatus Hadarchaeales archaeon]